MATTRNEATGRISRGAAGAALAVALLCAGGAAAETDLGPVRLSGEAELGALLVWVDGDKTKFREYRDLVDGVLSDFDLLLENEEITHWLRGRAEHMGYDDQRYWLEGGRYGRYEIEAFYGELPHLFSESARSPYSRAGDKTFVLPPGFPNIAAAIPDPSFFHGVDQELKWREGSTETRYHLGESLDFEAGYRIQDKRGASNWGMNFGTPGGSFTSVPRRLDERIHEARLGADWMLGDDASLSLEYLGNFFQNDLSFVTAQNPNLNQSGTFGRAATPPDNWAQSLSLAGAASLPLGVPNRVSGSFVYGFRRQDDDFLPHTINPAFAGDPALVLPDSSLDGKVQTLLGNVVATVEPAEDLSARLRYRIYDFDNKTDSLFFPGDVENDGILRTDPEDAKQSVHEDYTRQNGDLELAWDFARGWTGGTGFGFEYWHRSNEREVEHLWDYGPNLKLDYRTPGGTLLHAGYQFRNRDGSHYDALAPLEAVHPNAPATDRVCPGNLAIFCLVRKFDEADRYLHRVDLLGQVVPQERVELTLTGNLDLSDYDQSSYGLTRAVAWHVGSDLYYQIHERVGVLSYYTYEWRKLQQDSRERNPSPPPLEDADWGSETLYQYHNGGVTLRLSVLPEKLDADIGYLIEYGEDKTRGKGGNAVNLPRVHDRLLAAYATVNWHFTERVTLRAGYRWEDYEIDNFDDDFVPATLVTPGPPSSQDSLLLGDVVDDYTANIFAISAVVEF